MFKKNVEIWFIILLICDSAEMNFSSFHSNIKQRVMIFRSGISYEMMEILRLAIAFVHFCT